jgi:hypothetical protein
MIHTFIISHERIFPIERGAKYYKWDEKKLLSMEKLDPFHTENKELGFKRKKIDSIYFDSKQQYEVE